MSEEEQNAQDDKNSQASPPQMVTEEGEFVPVDRPEEPEEFDPAPEDAEPDYEAEESNEDE